MNKERLDKQMNNSEYLIWSVNKIKELEEDCKFLLSFAPFGYVPEKVSPMFYKTGTYTGDLEMYDRIMQIQLKLSGYKLRTK